MKKPAIKTLPGIAMKTLKKTTQKKPAAKRPRRPTEKSHMARPAKVMKSVRKSGSLKALRLVTEAKTFEAFKAAVNAVSRANVKRLAEIHPSFLKRLVFRDGFAAFNYDDTSNREKLEILLDAGLDVDTPGLLNECARFSEPCFNLLLRRGADPLGDRARDPLGKCPFVILMRRIFDVRMMKTLKKHLEAHPKYRAHADQEWRDAIERMNESFLHSHPRMLWSRQKKWLRDHVLQYLDKNYAVCPPAPSRCTPYR